MPQSLPSTRAIQREARKAADSACVAASIARAMSSELQIQPGPLSPSSPDSSKHQLHSPPLPGSSLAAVQGPSAAPVPSSRVFGKSATANKSKPPRQLQAYDIFRAIEKKNLEVIFAARDSAFHLLVTPHGGVQPIVHCLRLGKSHQDITILVTGALSRFVNNIPSDAPIDKPTRLLLHKVRSNLKIAINESLQSNQTDLVSSYLQVILMTEGDKWLLNQTQLTALALRQGKAGKPVHSAHEAVRRFATTELKSRDKLAAVEEFTANASIDLVLLGLWAIVAEVIGDQGLPLYQFARECVHVLSCQSVPCQVSQADMLFRSDRLFRSFTDRVAAARNAPRWGKVGKVVREQIRICADVLPTRAVSQSTKLRAIQEKLDGVA